MREGLPEICGQWQREHGCRVGLFPWICANAAVGYHSLNPPCVLTAALVQKPWQRVMLWLPPAALGIDPLPGRPQKQTWEQ